MAQQVLIQTPANEDLTGDDVSNTGFGGGFGTGGFGGGIGTTGFDGGFGTGGFGGGIGTTGFDGGFGFGGFGGNVVGQPIVVSDVGGIGTVGAGTGIGAGFSLLAPLALLLVATSAISSSGGITGITTSTCPVCTTPAASVCTTPVPCSPTPTCPGNFIKLSGAGLTVPNKCYIKTTQSQIWRRNLVECHKLGGYLVNVETTTEGLAVKDYLKSDPDTPYHVGYTDLLDGGGNNDIISTSGGPTDVPVFGVITKAVTTQCVTFKVSNAGTTTVGDDDCTVAQKALCEVDITKQSCTCS